MDVNSHGPAALADLFHHRWTVPILAELHRSAGAKYVTLQRRLGINRDSLRRTLDELIERELAMRNPGYGHPMRPEYILAPGGRQLASHCTAVLERLEESGAVDIGLRKWSLAVLLAVAEGAQRFSVVRATLPHATPRALTLTLRQLSQDDLLIRDVIDDYPPRTRYRPSPRASSWIPALAALAKVAEQATRT